MNGIITKLDVFGNTTMLNINNIGVTYGFIFITNAASLISVICIVALIWAIWGKKTSRYAFINVICTFIMNFIIKNIVRRARPDGIRMVNASGYSFPSAHSMVAISLYGFLMYIIHTKVKSKKIKVTLNSILSILIITIGMSRIYLGVHYTTDVIGGLICGLICVILFIEFVYKKDKFKKICTYDIFSENKKKNSNKLNKEKNQK